MKVIKHINGMFDVFSGIGWEHHTRIQRIRIKQGHAIRFVDGQRLPVNAIKALAQNLTDAHYQTVPL